MISCVGQGRGHSVETRLRSRIRAPLRVTLTGIACGIYRGVHRIRASFAAPRSRRSAPPTQRDLEWNGAPLLSERAWQRRPAAATAAAHHNGRGSVAVRTGGRLAGENNRDAGGYFVIVAMMASASLIRVLKREEVSVAKRNGVKRTKKNHEMRKPLKIRFPPSAALAIALSFGTLFLSRPVSCLLSVSPQIL